MFGLACALALAAGQATDLSTQTCTLEAQSQACAADAATLAALERIEYQTFMALPVEHQRLIIGNIESGNVEPELLADLPEWLTAQLDPSSQFQDDLKNAFMRALHAARHRAAELGDEFGS